MYTIIYDASNSHHIFDGLLFISALGFDESPNVIVFRDVNIHKMFLSWSTVLKLKKMCLQECPDCYQRRDRRATDNYLEPLNARS